MGRPDRRRDRTADVALCWQPIADQDQYRTQPLATEGVVIALAATHALAARDTVRFADVTEVPLLALPEEAGPLRDFWLAAHARQGRPSPVAATVASADEALDAVAAGIGGALMSTGNAALYQRPGIAYVPVIDLPPAQLALVARRDDTRDIVLEVKNIASAMSTAPTGER